MVKIVIAGHYGFPKGMKKTGEFISGLEHELIACTLHSDEQPKDYKEKLQSVIQSEKDADQIIIFCDLIGGTPFKAAMQLAQKTDKQIKIVGGANLPSLLTGIMIKDNMNLEDIISEVIKEGKNGIKAF